MKMKNPIRATHAGTVAEIAVAAGQTVAYGEVADPAGVGGGMQIELGQPAVAAVGASPT